MLSDSTHFVAVVRVLPRSVYPVSLAARVHK